MKKSKPKSITLTEWIEEMGVSSIARLLKINPSTVRHWRLGTSLPYRTRMHEIRKLSKNRVSYEGMIETRVKKNRGAR